MTSPYYGSSRRKNIEEKVARDWMKIDLVRMREGDIEWADTIRLNDYHSGTGNLVRGGYESGGKTQFKPVRDKIGVITHLTPTSKDDDAVLVRPTEELADKIRLIREQRFGKRSIGEKFVTTYRGMSIIAEVIAVDVVSRLVTAPKVDEFINDEWVTTQQEEAIFLNFGDYELSWKIGSQEYTQVLSNGRFYSNIGNMVPYTAEAEAEAQFKADIEGVRNEVVAMYNMAKDYRFESAMKDLHPAAVAGFRQQVRALRNSLKEAAKYEK